MYIEDYIINQLNLKIKDKNLIESIGDDCCIIKKDDKDILITMDYFIEETHFVWDYYNEDDVAYKSLAVNISDCAAMGITPQYILLGLGIPAQENKKRINKYLNSLKKYLTEYKIKLIGGDTVKSDKWNICITAIGLSNKYVLRNNANTGDDIYICGYPGLSAYGYKLLNKGTANRKNAAVKKHLKPEIMLGISKELLNKKICSSMIDLSDGISKDIYGLIDITKTGAIIFEKDFIYHSVMKKLRYNEKLNYFLNGGEDYILMFTSNSRNSRKIEKIAKKYKTTIQKIGIVTKKRKIILENIRGAKCILKRRTYEHFT